MPSIQSQNSHAIPKSNLPDNIFTTSSFGQWKASPIKHSKLSNTQPILPTNTSQNHGTLLISFPLHISSHNCNSLCLASVGKPRERERGRAAFCSREEEKKPQDWMFLVLSVSRSETRESKWKSEELLIITIFVHFRPTFPSCNHLHHNTISSCKSNQDQPVCVRAEREQKFSRFSCVSLACCEVISGFNLWLIRDSLSYLGACMYYGTVGWMTLSH